MANSASQPVLWLLEELGIDYDIRKFERGDGPAPAELKDTHAQGKSPQLLTADGRVITQMSAILLYLIQTYDTQNRFHRPGVNDPVREEQLVCIGVADMAQKFGMKLIFAAVAARSPFFVRPLLNYIGASINRLVLNADLDAIMDVLEAELDGRDWFMGGDGPSRPDFVLRFFVDLGTQSKLIELNKYPKITAWWARCDAREA